MSPPLAPPPFLPALATGPVARGGPRRPASPGRTVRPTSRPGTAEVDRGGGPDPDRFDPNQPALPGMERGVHERLLARGFRFDVRPAGREEDHFLGVVRDDELASGMFVHARDDVRFAKGEVRTVFTEDRYRCQGLATALWRLAERLGMEPRHSDNRTDDGDAWARRLGGGVPPRRCAARRVA